MNRFADQAILVTGAGRGIGRETAVLLAKEGGFIAVVDKNAASATEVANEILAQGCNAVAYALDVTDAAGVARVIKDFAKQRGLNGLVNCAGSYKASPNTLDIDVADWDLIIESNLKGTFLCCQESLPFMLMKGEGRIVNLSSQAARSSSPYLGVHYTAAKSGVVGLTRHLAKEFGPRGIRVNAVAAGPVRGARLNELINSDQEAERASKIPLRRLAEASDIASAIRFLMSREADFISGVTLDVNGGESVS